MPVPSATAVESADGCLRSKSMGAKKKAKYARLQYPGEADFLYRDIFALNILPAQLLILMMRREIVRTFFCSN